MASPYSDREKSAARERNRRDRASGKYKQPKKSKSTDYYRKTVKGEAICRVCDKTFPVKVIVTDGRLREKDRWVSCPHCNTSLPTLDVFDPIHEPDPVAPEIQARIGTTAGRIGGRGCK